MAFSKKTPYLPSKSANPKSTSKRKDAGKNEQGIKLELKKKKEGTEKPVIKTKSGVVVKLPKSSGKKETGSGSKSKNPKKLNKTFNPNEAIQRVGKDESIRLNKFLAHSGLCSRRDADAMIESGKVKVNGKIVKELGVSVKRDDEVSVSGQKISLEPFTYILLNKSRDVISTTNDERDRQTVLDQIESATGLRVYPVGRLDRNTTGLLLLTNDGDLAHRLMHPSYQVKKTYEVGTARPLTEAELEQLRKGVPLEDGMAKGVGIRLIPPDPSFFEISVFEGRNRIIRRMVEYFETEVIHLKRIFYAGLNLKGLRMGRWRFLKQREIVNIRKLVKLEALDFKKHTY